MRPSDAAYITLHYVTILKVSKVWNVKDHNSYKWLDISLHATDLTIETFTRQRGNKQNGRPPKRLIGKDWTSCRHKDWRKDRHQRKDRKRERDSDKVGGVNSIWVKINKSPVRQLAVNCRLTLTTLGKVFTVTHVPLSPSCIIWYWSNSGDALRKRL